MLNPSKETLWHSLLPHRSSEVPLRLLTQGYSADESVNPICGCLVSRSEHMEFSRAKTYAAHQSISDGGFPVLHAGVIFAQAHPRPETAYTRASPADTGGLLGS